MSTNLAEFSRRVRILSFQSGASLAGTELRNFSVLRRMHRDHFQITVCFLDEEGPMSRRYREEGFEVIHLDYHRRPLPLVAWNVFRLLRDRCFHIVHIYGLRANLLGRTLGKLAGCRHIITSQRSTNRWRPRWQVWLDRFTSGCVSLYIANALAVAERLRHVEGIREEKLRVIQNGLDPTPFEKAQRGRIRGDLGIGPEEVVVACVANLRAVKGHDVLFEAADRLTQAGLQMHLWLVGDGSLRTAAKAKVQQLGLAHCIHFLGHRTDIPDILADADVFVLASHWEGMPGAIMEAMASALPVVATRVGGVPELVIDGRTGFLVPPGDPWELASALEALLEDPTLRNRLGEAGYRRITAEFRLEDKVREQEQVYRELLECSD